jgi:protein-tyrosine phosphatase
MVHNFNPAAKNETIVFGCAAPGFPLGRPGQGMRGWLAMLQQFGVKRVVCLLSEEQIKTYGNLVEACQDAFGPSRFLWAPMRDHHLAPLDVLTERVLPFLEAADQGKERVAVHCLAGLGRTGQVLAAWLVHARGMNVTEAIRSVRDHGRIPDEAIRHGNAAEGDLEALLAAIGEARSLT